MYPPGDATRVRVAGLSRHLCGETRPHHFEGVATIVTKLFSVAGPCSAVFGKKDYQQLKIVERLVTDLMLPVTIVPCPTRRHDDGVAMSSRNQYLSPAERQRARALVLGLSSAARAFQRGVRSVSALRGMVEGSVVGADLQPEYTTIADPETLTPLPDADEVKGIALLAVAARVGATRLIDNLVLGEDPDPLG
jgi:pantoate--beta-alanine ligase